MIGAVIIANASIGSQLIATAEYIVGKLEGVTSVSIDLKKNVFDAKKSISRAIQQVDQGNGILLLTDLFGGSPSSIAFSFLNKDTIEVVTGVNLPMILTFWSKRPGNNLHDLAVQVHLAGTRGIIRARMLMKTGGGVRTAMTRIERRLSQK